MSYFLNLTELIKDIIFPPLCVVCGKISSSYLCNDCASEIKVFGIKVCNLCGKPLDEPISMDELSKLTLNMDEWKSSGNDIKFCSLCKNENYYFYKARSFCVYEGAAAKIIHKYKYRGYGYLSKILVEFLKKAYLNYYINEKIDYIDTVPDYSVLNYHLRNFATSRNCLDSSKTGFILRKKNIAVNHMQFLALLFSKVTNIPFGDNLLKIKETKKQQKLDRSSRKVNLVEAFKVRNCLDVYGKNFLIIDDVWTTGSTLNEISFVMKQSGANKIFLLTLARPI